MKATPQNQPVNNKQQKDTKKTKKKKRKSKTKKQISKELTRNRRVERAIKKEQASKEPAIKKAAFRRLAKEVLAAVTPKTHVGTDKAFRITPKALLAIQEASEQYLVGRLSDAFAIASRHDRQTATAEDLSLICKLKPLG